jgi:hypothetical protein
VYTVQYAQDSRFWNIYVNKRLISVSLRVTRIKGLHARPTHRRNKEMLMVDDLTNLPSLTDVSVLLNSTWYTEKKREKRVAVTLCHFRPYDYSLEHCILLTHKNIHWHGNTLNKEIYSPMIWNGTTLRQTKWVNRLLSRLRHICRLQKILLGKLTTRRTRMSINGQKQRIYSPETTTYVPTASSLESSMWYIFRLYFKD